MKKIILPILLSLVFSQELKVEGDLRVNGVVLNTKVDSLELIIANQQVEIDSLNLLVTQLQTQILLLAQQLGLVDCSGEIGGDATEDACGVCNGNGIPEGGCNCFGAVLDVCGVCGGDAISEDECYDVFDIDGNGYNYVIIGTQEWMAENLKVTQYRNGDEIPNITNNGDWGSLSTGAYGDYDNNPSNSETYGRLYNWYTVDDSRGVCPDGWHIPSDAEYTVLTDYLGGTSVAGGKMKEAGLEHWNSPNTGATNESGFTGLPAGYRLLNNGGYLGMGLYGYFWSSTEYSSFSAWGRLLYYSTSEVYRYSDLNKRDGFSVRCLRD